MITTYEHPACTIHNGDALAVLRTLPSDSVHCCVTSPPYWGLRDYKVAGQLGLEKSFNDYLEKMVTIFREVRRVLRKDGTLWLNIGDAYCSTGGSGTQGRQGLRANRRHTQKQLLQNSATKTGLKPKDLIGMPWRVALTLQQDGWYLRQDIIWHKPNPMPESCKDRPAKAHEYLFLLSKSARYFYDAEPVREKVTSTAHPRGQGITPKAKLKVPDGWDTSKGNGAHGAIHRNGRDKGKQNESYSTAVRHLVSTRNKRSVWTVPTAPFKGSHFATFPPALIRPAILAGTSDGGCCPACGTPRKRIVKLGAPDLSHQRACGGDLFGGYDGTAQKDYASARAQNASEVKARILAGMRERKTVGWKSACKCEATGDAPCIVLDPFAGSGTTGEVSLKLNRRTILIELNPAYIPMILNRTAQPPLMRTL